MRRYSEANAFYSAHVLLGRALGELACPTISRPDKRSQTWSLNLDNVSHQVLDLRWIGDGGALHIS